MAEKLTEFAAEQQRRFDISTSPVDRKQHGHFGTPPAIAEFMAGMFSEIPSGVVRVLDPGAGVGVLSAAVCQRILREGVARNIHFELWENDIRLEPLLRATMEHCRRALQGAGHQMEYAIRAEDFILAHQRTTLFEACAVASFDLTILNPPYYKVRKDSDHARAMQHVVRGQPNIYAFFMAAAAELLVAGGEMVAITPRSYFNGSYFKRFRQWFFDRLVVRQIHVFESRTDAFRNDDVLQENVILRAEKGGLPADVLLTTSVGRNLQDIGSCAVAYDKAIDDADRDHVVRVAISPFEQQIVETLDGMTNRFCGLGFEISTGPVVTFRTTEFLRNERSADTAPLLWMHNVRPFVTQFPPKNGKPTHIAVSRGSRRLLLPASRYILLKRFTAKEEKRRLVAGIMEPGDSYSEWVGLENHLNYVYRNDAELSRAESFGLAGFFNSALVDRYFRALSGNTQVNATEIRSLPVPDEQSLAQIGEEIERAPERDEVTVERIVGKALRLPGQLIERLCEAAQ